MWRPTRIFVCQGRTIVSRAELELLEIGQGVKVASVRGGERLETELTPSARK